MKSSIFIPKTINVGYQNRSDTYTGKLAYVIYYDEKGKLRKEASWNSWRDEKISNEEFENVPTSGFVLNKKVGDYSSGWDHRQAYCRVYDPRNFEFEITVENLLYILENANSIKGKGLEGEFVYGWDGKDLVLMPVESPDYKQIVELLKRLNREKQTSILFISHDLSLVRQLCRRVMVMQGGYVVETGDTEEIFNHPREAYTQKLIAAIPKVVRKS